MNAPHRSLQIPFVTTRLRLIWLPASLAPPSLLAYWVGQDPAYRLTPTVYAHLHHAADKALSRPGVGEKTAAELIGALGVVYEALLAICQPGDVRPWTPQTPPLPIVPPNPRLDLGTAACDLDRGVVTAAGRWAMTGEGVNPMALPVAAESETAVRARAQKKKATEAGGLFG